jgi:DNA invertase Pin-like site-specific DNA recombinase
MAGNVKRRAVAYLRTSSAANVGEEKDSAKRQTEAICAYAGRNGIEVVASFYDAAVSGKPLPEAALDSAVSVSP